MKVSGYSLEDYAVWRIPEIEQLLPAAVFLPRLGDGQLHDQRSWLAPAHMDAASGLLRISIHSWILRTARQNILIDACCGNHKPRTRPETLDFANLETPYLERLKLVGLQPEDIHVVMCTHLHVDHVGWNTCLKGGRWVPTFANAKYLFSQTDYEFWDPAIRESADPHPNDGVFADSVAPVVEAGQAVLIADGHEIEPGVRVEARPGHTPGHVNVVVGSSHEQAIFSGDTMHHVLQVYSPHVNSAFCEHHELARQSRLRLLNRVADRATMLFPAHFGAPHAGRVVRRDGGFAFDFVEPDLSISGRPLGA
jgi:glyoxylase-like metal-dependent hydrolase (beta-lactamase superfamily II)